MAKGRTSQPLVIAVADSYLEHEKIQALKAQGHTVFSFEELRLNVFTELPPFDLILHPAAHFWNDMMWDFLPAALTAARKRKKERGQ